MPALPSPQERRQRLTRGFLLFGAGEAREKHQARKLGREWRSERRGEESRTRWVWALDLNPVAAGLSGWIPRGWTEDRREAEELEASRQLAQQEARADAVTRWYAAQVRARRTVKTAELAERLGAVDEAHGARLLEAWAFDLFHRRRHRHLWRALKRQEAHEAGLTGEEAQAQVRREEARLEALTARPALPVPPSRVKRPRPVEYRPQIQPNAPTN
ncbi:hypothetical protein GCM10008959_07420 [Deinococcus seoulensis]|uniref:Uncharacterized protein n=1 Tax=Deinococcus seoulensis TaxID=1837379 RepID=A0ABQ2RR47_9DEIO|nr:hypothetical protein [Deinococcus seoulensis]GGR48786.1 hypothetical protein GCM10008959_07420 [Deinococcus seoulensis]